MVVRKRPVEIERHPVWLAMLPLDEFMRSNRSFMVHSAKEAIKEVLKHSGFRCSQQSNGIVPVIWLKRCMMFMKT